MPDHQQMAEVRQALDNFHRECRVQPDDGVPGPVIIGWFGTSADNNYDADGLDLQGLPHSVSVGSVECEATQPTWAR